MERSRAPRARRLDIGDTVEYDGRDWIVSAVHDDGTVRLVRPAERNFGGDESVVRVDHVLAD
jgi:hypothetical protein